MLILIALLPLVQAALGISDFSAALGISDFLAALGIGAGQRLGLGSAGRRCGMSSAGQRWAALGSAGQRYWYWQRLAALGISRQRLVLALLSAGQRLGFGSAGQRCGMGSAGQRCLALPSATGTGSAGSAA